MNHYKSWQVLSVLLVSVGVGVWCVWWQPVVAAVQASEVVVVSAASYEQRCAAESIAVAFGTQLSEQVLVGEDTDAAQPGVQLPTTLGGTTVEVNGQRAGLFFVSPFQVNFLLPANLTSGANQVVVRNGSVTRNGTAQVAAAAPGIFTFNGNGQGVIAGTALRARDGALLYESLAQLQGDRYVTRPIDLGPPNDQVYLVFYGTGWRQAGNETRVVIGGETVIPQFAGAQGELLGLDQVNVLVPRSLLGRGQVTIAVSAPNLPPSNLGELEIAGAVTGNAPTIATLSSEVAQAAETITITGNGFSANASDNLVRIGNIEAQIISATNNQIIARVPFGSDTSKVLVRTSNGDGWSPQTLRIRTSLSGVVQSTGAQPLPNVEISALVGLQRIKSSTANSGTFVLSEFNAPQNGSAYVVVDGSKVPTAPQFGRLTLNQSYLSGRDTQFGNPLTLQQINGVSGQVGGSGNGSGLAAHENNASAAVNTVIETEGVQFELPNDAAVRFPDGATSGEITLTLVENAELPLRWPTGLWTGSVVQITPFGTQFSKGGTLRFPNTENYPAGARLIICQLDQGETSKQLGEWIAPGNATVSSDGQVIETDPGTITQGSYYFVAGVRQSTAVAGRVIESSGAPARRVRVQLRGQETLTDGNGGFVIRNVPHGGAADSLVVRATASRPNGRLDVAKSDAAAPVVNGLTEVGLIILPDPESNQAPTMIAAPAYRGAIGVTTEHLLFAYDFEDGKTPRVEVSGLSFASIVARNASAEDAAFANAPEQTGLLQLRLATPATQTPGTYPLTITATDSDGATTSRNVNVVLTLNNRPPVLTVPGAQNVLAGNTVSFTISATDPDAGQTLSYVAANLPSGATFNTAMRTFTWAVPPNTNAGDYTVGFRVTDSGTPSLSDTKTVTITVGAFNNPPVLSVPGAQAATAGTTVSFTISATDLDAGQTLTYAATALPSGATFNAATRTFTWAIPTNTAAGDYTATFTVTDNGVPAKSDSESVTITVSAFNNPPVLTVPGTQTVTAGATVSFTISATDPDAGQTLTYAAITLPSGATFNAATRTFVWAIPANTAAGGYTATFTVTDNGTPAKSDTKAVTITVGAFNNPPVLMVPTETLSAVAGNPLTFTISATDPDAGQTLSYAVNTLPPGASFNIATRVFTWTPTQNTPPGNYTATFTVTDNGTPVKGDTKSVTISVGAFNNPPTLTVTGTGVETINNNGVISYQVTVIAGATLSLTVNGTDPDAAQTLTYAAPVMPAGAVFDATKRAFQWTPSTTLTAGNYPATFTVTDNGTPIKSDSKNVTIRVVAFNNPPVLNLPANQTVTAGSQVAFVVTANDPDAGQTLTFTATNLPSGSSFGQLTRTFSWTPSANVVGTFTINFSVTDNGVPAKSDSGSVTITVRAANVAPVLSVPSTQTVVRGNTLSFTISATDANAGQTITYAATSLPSGASFNASTRSFSWSVPSGQAVGSYTATFRATDNGSPALSDTRSVTINVTAPNNPPVLTVPGTQGVLVGATLTFTISATDPDAGQTITYAATALPSGATFNAGTRRFTWYVPNNNNVVGTYMATFRATDNGNPALSDTKSVRINVTTIGIAEPSGSDKP